MFRVWSRDWWHNSNHVMSAIVKEIEKQVKILYKDSNTSKNAKLKEKIEKNNK